MKSCLNCGEEHTRLCWHCIRMAAVTAAIAELFHLLAGKL